MGNKLQIRFSMLGYVIFNRKGLYAILWKSYSLPCCNFLTRVRCAGTDCKDTSTQNDLHRPSLRGTGRD